MTRSLEVVVSAAPAELMRVVRAALSGDGPALLPRSIEVASDGHPTPAVVARNVALVIETSGSTGAPKRVALSRDALLASAAASASALATQSAESFGRSAQAQWLLALPTHYVAGIQVLVRSIVAGTEPVVLPAGHFDATVFKETAATMTGEARFVSLVPVQFARLLDAADGDAGLLAILRRFDAILVGGQALRPELSERSVALGLRVVRTYGSSETCGGCVYNGVPIGTTRVRVSDGMLEISGPVLAEGYLGDPARTGASFRDDGTRWYRTGDLGSIAADGRVTVLGRADNVIISGGEKVLLDAVERCVRELPGFDEAVVVAAESVEWGQVPVVVVAGSPPSALERVRGHVAARLGRAAAPARILRVDRMPQLASGKPDRVALAARVASAGPAVPVASPAASADPVDPPTAAHPRPGPRI